MPASTAVTPLRWHSYWQRSPLALHAQLGDREEEGLSEVLSLLRQRPAAAIAVPAAEVFATLRSRVREAGFGLVRLKALQEDVTGEGTTILLMLGSTEPSARAGVEAAAKGLARAHGVPWILLSPGDDVAARLDALVRLVR